MKDDKIKNSYYYPKQFRSTAWMPSTKENDRGGWIIFAVAVLIISMGIWAYLHQSNQMALPHNGAVIRYEKMRDDVESAYFTVESDKADVGLHSDVKIMRWDSESPVADLFVVGGHDASIKLPLGKYKLKISQGQRWYGVEHLFGLFTTTDEFIKPIVIYKNESGELVGVILDMHKRMLDNYPSKRVMNNE